MYQTNVQKINLHYAGMFLRYFSVEFKIKILSNYFYRLCE